MPDNHASVPASPAAAAAISGDVTRLAEHLANQQVVQHVQAHKVDELQFYPAHDQRTESSAYVAAHKHMTQVLDLPCLVCGVRNSTLKSAANRYGAKAMETHHHIIEWALANAVDTQRFNDSIRPNLAHKHPNDPVWTYETPFTDDQVRQWVDHSEHNLWVLCDVHHRAKFLGIHEITYPIWAPQDLLRADFQQWALDSIKKIKGGADPRAVIGVPDPKPAPPPIGP
jgi:hypothetical protein